MVFIQHEQWSGFVINQMLKLEYINGLVQDFSNTSVLAMELL